MENHKQVTQEVEKMLNEGQRDDPIIPKKYKAHSDEFLRLPSEFENMWDGHLGRIKTTKHRIELSSTGVHPVHRAPYHEGLISRQFTAKEVQKMLQE